MTDKEQKLHIDDDWKSEAAAEKDRLSQTLDNEAQPTMPEGGFLGLVQMMAMQAMVGLGGMAGPGGREIPPNLDLAKLHIDFLEVLDEKTKGNLNQQEKQLLDTTVHQLRMAYVEAVRGGGAPPGIPQPPPA
jgi:hypothetical protein